MNDRCCPNCDAPLEYCVSCGTGFSRFEIDVPKRPDQPQRVQPSREDAVRAIRAADWWPVDAPHGLDGIAADAVLALFAQQPTVAEVKAEALRRAARDRSLRNHGHAGVGVRRLLDLANRIEREVRS